MTIMDYIKEQSSVFAAAIDRDIDSNLLSDVISKNNIERIYIIASGTSKNAALAALPFISSLIGLDMYVIPPSSMPKDLLPNSLVIYISQGGASTNTISALKAHIASPNFVLTGNLAGKICSYSDNIIEIPCGPENVGPKTKGYTITILQLYLMFIHAASALGRINRKQAEDYIGIIRQSGAFIDDNINRSVEWVTANADQLSALQSVYIAGKAQGASIAYEGALKLMETLLIPATGYEFEEYLHGPVCSISDTVSGIYILPPASDPDFMRFEAVAGYHRSICRNVFVIGNDPDDDLQIAATGEAFTEPFETIIPFQVISAMIPVKKGIDGEGSRRFASVDSLVSTKSR